MMILLMMMIRMCCDCLSFVLVHQYSKCNCTELSIHPILTNCAPSNGQILKEVQVVMKDVFKILRYIRIYKI